MRNILTVIVGLLLASPAKAQGYLQSKEDLSKHSERVMIFLRDSQFDKSFVELKKYWPLPENELTQLETQTVRQFNVATDRFGNIIGSDFVKDMTIKDFVIRKIYVIRFEKHMLRVIFTYYKNDKGWALNGFKWDDQIEELLE